MSEGTKKRQKKEWQDMSTGEKITGMTALILIAIVVILVLWSILGHIGGSSTTSASSTSNVEQTAPTQTTTAQQVAAWAAAHKDKILTLANDMTQIQTDSKNTSNNMVTVLADCKLLQRDVATAQSLPAIPDAQSANDWSSSLTYLASAAQDCIAGISNNDVSLIQTSDNDMNLATDKINAVNADIKSLTN